ncbi:unnamed protein product [Prorocentrum cordatum]|uniref:Uncharacterized protein n=1 Tax=Prorocentrum cordatum TaxID=2364126 RepID=A0ABN9R7Y0_9DINO|nr:unnamed protein product [Polarella glacialis]
MAVRDIGTVAGMPADSPPVPYGTLLRPTEEGRVGDRAAHAARFMGTYREFKDHCRDLPGLVSPHLALWADVPMYGFGDEDFDVRLEAFELLSAEGVPSVVTQGGEVPAARGPPIERRLDESASFCLAALAVGRARRRSAPASCANAPGGSGDGAQIVPATVADYSSFSRGDLLQLVIAKGARVSGLNHERDQFRKSKWKAMKQKRQLQIENSRLKTTIQDIESLVSVRTGEHGNADKYKAYCVAINRNEGYAGAAVAVKMMAGGEGVLGGGLKDKGIIITYEHMAAASKRLRSNMFFDARVLCDLQDVREGTGQETYSLMLREFDSVGAPTGAQRLREANGASITFLGAAVDKGEGEEQEFRQQQRNARRNALGCLGDHRFELKARVSFNVKRPIQHFMNWADGKQLVFNQRVKASTVRGRGDDDSDKSADDSWVDKEMEDLLDADGFGSLSELMGIQTVNEEGVVAESLPEWPESSDGGSDDPSDAAPGAGGGQGVEVTRLDADVQTFVAGKSAGNKACILKAFEHLADASDAALLLQDRMISLVQSGDSVDFVMWSSAAARMARSLYVVNKKVKAIVFGMVPPADSATATVLAAQAGAMYLHRKSERERDEVPEFALVLEEWCQQARAFGAKLQGARLGDLGPCPSLQSRV